MTLPQHCAMLGIIMICSGLFHLVRASQPGEVQRVWLGIGSLLLVVIGVVFMLRRAVNTAEGTLADLSPRLA